MDGEEWWKKVGKLIKVIKVVKVRGVDFYFIKYILIE